MPLSRIAVVTGANKGIGYHIALQLASCGLFRTVILACRNPSLGQTAVDTMKQQLMSSSESSSSETNVVYMPLTIGNVKSHEEFQDLIKNQFGGRIDVLINNAAIAFKNADPTPFQDQCKPTLDINFRGTVDFTERMIPFMKGAAEDARIVNVASMAGRLDQIKSPQLREQFQSSTLTMPELHALVNQFEHSVVQDGDHLSKGWGNSNYGFSKLALIAATKVWARQHHPTIRINCCCPGYCDTDMTSHKGPRPPSEGAKNAVLPAIINIDNCPTGQYIANQQIASW